VINRRDRASATTHAAFRTPSRENEEESLI